MSLMNDVFNVTNGKLIVTDPCYKRGIRCQAIVDNVKNGTWTANISKHYERVAELEARHAEAFSYSSWERLDAEIGVDSGQAGIFNEALYPAGDILGEYDDTTTFYGRACAATLPPELQSQSDTEQYEPFGFIEEGVVSSSGYGDGSYDAFVARNAAGEVVAVKIVFVSEEEDEASCCECGDDDIGAFVDDNEDYDGYR